MALELLLESSENLKVDVKLDGVTPATGVQFATLRASSRPVSTDWTDGTFGDGVWRLPVSGKPKGTYDVWVRVQGSVARLRNAFKVV